MSGDDAPWTTKPRSKNHTKCEEARLSIGYAGRMFRRILNVSGATLVGFPLVCACATSNPGAEAQPSNGATGTVAPGSATSTPCAPHDAVSPAMTPAVGTSGAAPSGESTPSSGSPTALATSGGTAAGTTETAAGGTSSPMSTSTSESSPNCVSPTSTDTTAAGGTTSSTESSPNTTVSPNSSTPDTSGLGPEPFVFGQAPAASTRFKKGINLGNRMEAPNEGDWGGSIVDSDFPFIAQRGFDHVRIPMKFSGHAQTSAPYTIEAEFFSRVDTVVNQALAANLAVIIDMHAYDEMATDAASERERFLGLWSQIATRYKDLPDSVAFELMNEPNGDLDDVWNDFLAAAITTVRVTNPRRLLVVDAVFWADPPKLSILELPNDANLLVAVHLYEPKLFSMQGKSWMGPEYMTTGILFPGPPAAPVTPVEAATEASWAAQWFDDYNTLPAESNPSGPATVEAHVAFITDYQATEGRTVYNGEWGPQDGGDMDSRVRLVTEVRRQCEQANVGWAIWEDPNNMQLMDSEAGTWVTPIIDALLPP
jgi:endoglucanase